MGDHVPVNPLFESVGNENELPLQNGPSCVNVGAWLAVTVIVALPLVVFEQLPIETFVTEYM